MMEKAIQLDVSNPSVETVSKDAFKLGMRRLAASVSIVTTADGGQNIGLTATAVCSVSAEPPTLLACVNRKLDAARVIQQSGSFAINILSAQQAKFAEVFGISEKKQYRFLSSDWDKGAYGAPVLHSAVAVFECRLMRSIDVGSHKVVFGSVVDIRLNESDQPLLYSNGRFGALAALEV